MIRALKPLSRTFVSRSKAVAGAAHHDHHHEHKVGCFNFYVLILYLFLSFILNFCGLAF
jgi:hypothetical protein